MNVFSAGLALELSSCDTRKGREVNRVRWKSIFSIIGLYDKGSFPCGYILLYLIFLEALIISLMRGTPKVMFIEATPAKWKVFNVIWVPGSPMLCAQRAPTAEPGSIWALCTRYRHMMRQEAGATSFKLSFHSADWRHVVMSLQSVEWDVMETDVLTVSSTTISRDKKKIYIYTRKQSSWSSILPGTPRNIFKDHRSPRSQSENTCAGTLYCSSD